VEMICARNLDPARRSAGAGEVYLVGAGPGDPELLTLRALRLIQDADVVLYDSLIAPEILELLPRTAERIHVGKRRNRHTLPQEQIHTLMIEMARSGRRVLRLKAGDPFIFGRGGEELEALTAAGIACHVVPGITAAIGASASARIPLTHRNLAQSCTFVTGHQQDGSSELDWAALARSRQTLVIYMGLHGLENLCARLIEHGLGPDTAAAIIQQATRPEQRVVVGTLQSLPEQAVAEGIKAPTVIMVGDVVSVHRQSSLCREESGHA